MKTSEFKKRLGELEYAVYEDGRFLYVETLFGKKCARICNVSDLFELNTVSLELAKLCIEYAETPISEREDKKKYMVVLPDPRNDGIRCQALYKGPYGIFIGYVYRRDLQGFTEAEIKRNHEYLWQFAKEVQE